MIFVSEIEVHDEAIQFLKTIDKPVVVVVIAGSFRQGKSTLINYMIGKPGGFEVAPGR